MEHKHTPGPWKVHQHWEAYHGISIRAGDISLFEINVGEHNAKHGEANANLIAAAPELLEALEEIAGVNDVDGNSMDCDSHEECQYRAQEAINKAKGK